MNEKMGKTIIFNEKNRELSINYVSQSLRRSSTSIKLIRN